MPKIIGQHFRVNSLDNLSDFYCTKLGMQDFSADKNSKRFGYNNDACCLTFSADNLLQYVAAPNDLYWKIGITLQKLDVAVAFLRQQNVAVTNPRQFRDIGYMSKITDPNGFIIELLQHGFEGDEESPPNGHPLGAQATLAHITLRVIDIDAAQDYFEGELGMRLMSVQPVADYNFCLYFYSWSNEKLPNPALDAVENRPWLWRRPYTFIELQHLNSPEATLQTTADDMCGFDGFSFVEGDKTIRVSTAKLTKHL